MIVVPSNDQMLLCSSDVPYRKRLTRAILRLQSSQVIDELKRKWWEERRGGGQCIVGVFTNHNRDFDMFEKTNTHIFSGEKCVPIQIFCEAREK